MLASWKEDYDKSRQRIKKQRHHSIDKGQYSQSHDFSSSHVQMWELDHEEGWPPKNWCFRIVVWVKTLESHLDSKGIKPVNPKGNQPWILTGRPEAEAPTLWPPDANSQLTGKDPDAGKDWRQKEKMRWLDSITDSMDMNSGKLWNTVRERKDWSATVDGVARSWTWLSD